MTWVISGLQSPNSWTGDMKRATKKLGGSNVNRTSSVNREIVWMYRKLWGQFFTWLFTSPFSPRILVAEEYSWCKETYFGLGSRFGIGKSLYHPIIKALPNNCDCELWRWDKSLSLHNSRTPLVPQWPWREKDGWSSMENQSMWCEWMTIPGSKGLLGYALTLDKA